MPRSWTWLAMLVITVGAVLLVDAFDSPSSATADAGKSLTKPIPPATNKQRLGKHRDRIAWYHAQERIGRTMPVGRGIAVGQVEAPFQGGYLADTRHPDLPKTTVIDESAGGGTSGHATQVASAAFGPDSAGQGVPKLHGWNVNDWLGKGYLNTATLDDPKHTHPARIFNHSWVGSGGQTDALVLRRVDYLVDKYDKVVVCGVHNKPGKIPHLLASAYNVISVGVLTGKNSDALTSFEGPGRCKPEIVAPGNLTSFATGVVTGCAAALLELADRKIKETKDDEDQAARFKDAARSEVIKAALLAGAFRPGRWQQPEGEPLDRKLGPGMVDLDRAIVILDAGHVEPSSKPDAEKTTDQRYGWSFAQIDAGKTQQVRFTIDAQQGEVGVVLVWHRRVLGGAVNVKHPTTGEVRKVWNAGHFTPNLDLSVVRIAPDGQEREVAASASKVDNLELIQLRALAPGTYALRVKRAEDKTDMAWDFALAWRIEAP